MVVFGRNRLFVTLSGNREVTYEKEEEEEGKIFLQKIKESTIMCLTDCTYIFLSIYLDILI